MNILIVDDDIHNIYILKKLIKKNFEAALVFDASNGLEAMELLSTVKIDLILLDLLMPVMNGLDFIKELQSQNIKTPFIVVSGSLESKRISKLFENGALDCISKPYFPEILSQKLKSLLCG